MKMYTLAASAALALSLAASAGAVTVPFTETFSSAANNWSTASVLSPVNLVATGGPDGSQFANRTFSFSAANTGDQAILFRGQTNFGSSGGNLHGNYLTSGVTDLSLFVRNDSPVALDFFVRFGTPNPGAGVVFLASAVPANSWTMINVPISMSTPFIYEGAPTLFSTVFANVGRIQVGVVVPASLALSTPSYNFDLDSVSIVPAPSAAVALLGAGAVALRRRRR